MKNLKYIISLTLILSVSFSQDKLDMEAVEKIKDHGMTDKSKVMEIAWYMTDVIGPKLTASPGGKKANEWAVKKLKEWGLENVEEEAWGGFGKGWVNKGYSVEMMAPYYQRLIVSPRAWSSGTDGVVTGKPMLVEIKDEADFDKYRGKLRGKIIVPKVERKIALADKPDAVRHSDEALEKMEKAEAGQGGRTFTPEMIARWRARRALSQKITQFYIDEGVSAILSISRRGRHGTVFTNNGASRRIGTPDGPAEFEVLSEHHLKLQRLLSNNIDIELKLSMTNVFNYTDTIAYNVIGEIPGKGDLEDEIVMLGAHYDSWHASDGATDNSSGSSVMMEVMRILQAIEMNDSDNHRTIRIALWTGEEQGLLGSRAYVKKHFADRTTMELKDDHDKISAYYNIDNGTGKVRGVYLQGNEKVRPIFAEYLKPFHEHGAKTLTINNTGGTDHQSFDGVGIPGFQFIQDRLEYRARTHHSNMDNYDRLQEDDLKQIATIVATFVYHTATRAEKLPRKKLPEASPSLF